MKFRQFVMIMTGILFSISVIAQEMPAAQKNLMKFKGKWICKNAKFEMGGKTYTGIYTVECLPVNDNTGILAHEKFVNDEIGTMLGENLIGYDPNLQQVHMYSIDNMGTAHDHRGYWIDDNHLFLQYQGAMDDKMYVEQIDMKIKDANTMNFKLTGMLNGETFQKGEFTYVRQ